MFFCTKKNAFWRLAFVLFFVLLELVWEEKFRAGVVGCKFPQSAPPRTTTIWPLHTTYTQTSMTLHFLACMCLQSMQMLGFRRSRNGRDRVRVVGGELDWGVVGRPFFFVCWEAEGPGCLWTAPAKQGPVSGAVSPRPRPSEDPLQ